MPSLPEFPEFLQEVERRVLAQFQLDPLGPHGMPHWQRVLRNGVLIYEADKSNVDLHVVTAFALLHDSCRINEDDDPMHGVDGARFMRRLAAQGLLAHLDEEQLTLLSSAIIDHPRGFVILEPRIQACWDADRLDLGRVGIEPARRYLGSVYGLTPGVAEAHWEESWNPEAGLAIIEAVQG